MPEDPFSISVYIIGRNCRHTLTRALDSVYRQTRPVDEVVYLDDGSSDDSLEIAKRYLDRGLVLLANEASQGIPAARNRAARACTGRWVAVLDADDCWHEEKIARQADYLRDQPAVGLVGTFARVVDDNDEMLGVITAPTDDAGIKKTELTRNCFIHSSVVFRRDLFERIGGYSDLAAAQDYDLMLRVSERARMANLPHPLTDYRIDSNATSVRKRDTQRACARKARDDAYRRRGLRPGMRSMAGALAYRLYLAAVLFDPRVHWGIHQLLLGDPTRGRELLRRARPGGLRNRLVAGALLMIPDFGYRAFARLFLSA